MKYLSLFSGIGGFELGIGPKHECVGYSEIDKYATQIYQKHFPTHHNYGDITKIDEVSLTDFDLLVGGFPCQSFSVAGKRGGFSDTRGTLFFDIARIIKEKHPRLLLLENVKGLLSHDEGRTFLTIISTLDELGYDLQWQVLNSKNHGVPQNRERIFIVGHLRGTSRPQVFPFGHDAGVPDQADESEGTQSPTKIASTIRTKQGSRADDNYVVGTLRTHKDGNGFRIKRDGLVPTIPARAREAGSGQPVIFDLKAKGSKTRRGVISDKGYAKTLDQQCMQSITRGMQIRRLTPVECERLQGFPDGWTEKGVSEEGKEVLISDTQRYKTLGNAITTCVVKEIVLHLLHE